MAHDLRAVEHEQGARIMGHLGKPLHGGHGAEHVRAPRHRDDLHLAIGEQLRVMGLIEVALGGEPSDAEVGACGKTRLLPGNIIGVVLHKAHHDGIVGPEHVRQAAGHHVQAIGRAACKHHARRIGRADQSGQPSPEHAQARQSRHAPDNASHDARSRCSSDSARQQWRAPARELASSPSCPNTREDGREPAAPESGNPHVRVSHPCSPSLSL